MEIEYFKNSILPLKDKLFRKALSITESVVDAQDVVQDAMMKLWEKKGEWKSINNIEVFAMVLAKNMALDKVKKVRYNSDSIDSDNLQNLQNLQNNSLIQQEKMEKEEKEALVWKIISLLPYNYQKIIKLREVEELSYQQIAEEMNMSEEQVKVNLFRARKKIKETYLKINRNEEY
ncbi:RNA polymerase sigma factor (sigma-70 family) [Dysgonomonadaceae bacterium PH5-43]|nr:RNA polymerase sigma factor (sigma-70 family) [Dysgonomonadaceae bacterium PH5-43]